MTAITWHILAALVVCTLDVMTSSEITLWIAYLIPTGLATWNLGRRAGYSVAAVSVCLLLATWLHAQIPMPGLGAAIVLGSRAVVLCVFVELLSALRRKEVGRLFHPTQVDE